MTADQHRQAYIEQHIAEGWLFTLLNRAGKITAREFWQLAWRNDRLLKWQWLQLKAGYARHGMPEPPAMRWPDTFHLLSLVHP